jgi:hypothetical protein
LAENPCKLEEKVKAAIKKRVLELWPNSVSHMPVQGRFGSDANDHIFCIEGLYVEIEAKRLCKRPTRRQVDRMGAVRLAGGFAGFIAGCPDEPGSNFENVFGELDVWIVDNKWDD